MERRRFIIEDVEDVFRPGTLVIQDRLGLFYTFKYLGHTISLPARLVETHHQMFRDLGKTTNLL